MISQSHDFRVALLYQTGALRGLHSSSERERERQSGDHSPFDLSALPQSADTSPTITDQFPQREDHGIVTIIHLDLSVMEPVKWSIPTPGGTHPMTSN